MDIGKLKGNIQASSVKVFPSIEKTHVLERLFSFSPLPAPLVLSMLIYWAIASSTSIAVTSVMKPESLSPCYTYLPMPRMGGAECWASPPNRQLVVDIVEMLTRERDLGWLSRILGSSTSVICMLQLQPPPTSTTSPRFHHTRSRVMFNYNLLLYFGFPGYFVFCIKGFI